MDLATLTLIGSALGGGAFLFWAVISGFRKRAGIANAALEKAQGELLQVVTLEANAWQKRYEGEHAEYVEYRTASRAQTQATHELVLKLTTENAELKSKTDLSPVLQFQKEQSQINTKIVQSLDSILERLSSKNPPNAF